MIFHVTLTYSMLFYLVIYWRITFHAMMQQHAINKLPFHLSDTPVRYWLHYVLMLNLLINCSYPRCLCSPQGFFAGHALIGCPTCLADKQPRSCIRVCNTSCPHSMLAVWAGNYLVWSTTINQASLCSKNLNRLPENLQRYQACAAV